MIQGVEWNGPLFFQLRIKRTGQREYLVISNRLPRFAIRACFTPRPAADAGSLQEFLFPKSCSRRKKKISAPLFQEGSRRLERILSEDASLERRMGLNPDLRNGTLTLV